MDYRTPFASIDELFAGVAAEPVDPAQVVWGSPTTKTCELVTTDGPIDMGIWELRGGACRDIEAEEMFVVLSGRALLTVNGRPPQEISPGDIVKLEAGDSTTWAVRGVLRKLYLAPRGA
ncbi:MAG: cupin domain-containing protein [Rhodoglobus sp.]